jgi:hypothetical protein
MSGPVSLANEDGASNVGDGIGFQEEVLPNQPDGVIIGTPGKGS